MKIASVNSVGNFDKKTQINKNNTPFKSSVVMGTLGFTGALMQGIENQGYFLSFLIQDGLGMTLPRVITGFHRDKEITGKYNIKEGTEVALREGITGPFMMTVAPLLLFLTGKFCKSMSTNTRLIKVAGENLKELLSSSKITEAAKKDKNLLKREYYNKTIEKIYRQTVPNDKEADATLNYLKEEFNKFASSTKKGKSEEHAGNIVNKINEKIIETSSDFGKVHTLSIDVNGKTETFGAEDLLKAIKNYGIDVIDRNKSYAELSEQSVENITNNFATKRLMFNVGSVAATLGGLSVIPKIYAASDVAPGAIHMIEKKDGLSQDNTETSKQKSLKKEEIGFKGKGINSDGLFAKIGKFIHKKVPDWVKREFEYNGINFTNSLMACLSFFGLLIPRSIRAYNRAYIDENGKRDMTELHEIWLRDSISSLAVVFTVPILQKLFVSVTENKQGFVLTNRASDKFIDKINPYSKLRILSNKELQSIYGNIDSKTKMLNFMKYIDEKGGDIEKVLTYSKKYKEFLQETLFNQTLDKSDSKKIRNSKLISHIEKMEDNASTKESIIKLMNDAGIGKQGSIAKVARGLNSVPGFIATVIISPIILGVLIPMLTYSNTRKTHLKMENQKN